MNDRPTDHEIAAAERLIAGLINNPTLDPLAVRIAADRRPRAKAKRFLRDVLRTGPIQATAVQRQARAFGISDKTLRRAGKDLGVGIEKTGFRDGWTWALPEGGH